MHPLSLSTREIVTLRAGYFKKVRGFFAALDVLEADTNALSEYPALDPNIEPFSTLYFEPGLDADKNNSAGKPRFLHTSPEYAMKRLLADGSGAIYQIARVFRNGEKGRIHNPEFTMLEWYRPGFSMEELMDEVSLLIKTLLNTPDPSKTTYKDVFKRVLSINPFPADTEELLRKCQELDLHPPEDFKNEKDALLQYLLAETIEPGLGFDTPVFIYNFPPSQAALAKISSGSEKHAERFELYINGIEIANGYNELTDPVELGNRFDEENRRRVAQGKNELPPDINLVSALEKGLPDCSGVALGLDRLIMLAAGADSIHDILPLSFRL